MSTTTDHHCPQCGQPAQIRRIDKHYVLHEVQHMLHLEKGFFYTIKALLLHPGSTLREYISVSRSRHMKPVPFLVLASLIYTLIVHYFHIEDHFAAGYAHEVHTGNRAIEQSAVFTCLQWVQHNYGYANMIAGGIIALWIKLFFRKYGYNIFEINILLCFVIGEGMLLAAAGALLYQITGAVIIYKLTGLLLLLYVGWALGCFFDPFKPGSYIKAIIAYLIGFILFMLIVVIIGFGIDIISAGLHH